MVFAGSLALCHQNTLQYLDTLCSCSVSVPWMLSPLCIVSSSGTRERESWLGSETLAAAKTDTRDRWNSSPDIQDRILLRKLRNTELRNTIEKYSWETVEKFS